jgi:hypothetical protein
VLYAIRTVTDLDLVSAREHLKSHDSKMEDSDDDDLLSEKTVFQVVWLTTTPGSHDSRITRLLASC